MAGTRVLVGTRKGAFVLTSDERRTEWTVDGPHFPGWEIYHVKASPVDPDRIYASQTSGWFGQVIQRSDNGGTSWEPVDNDFSYEGETGDPQSKNGVKSAVDGFFGKLGVRRDRIARVRRQDVVLHDGTHLPIGKRYRAALAA